MISVAQRTSYPVIPAPRSRFAALTVTDTPSHLSGLDNQLRTLGATTVAHSGNTENVPRPISGADLCVLDGGADMMGELSRLRAAGWRRIVVAVPRPDPDAVRQLLGRGVRSVVVAPSLTNPVGSSATPHPQPGPHFGTLSDREVQVLQRVADGHSNRQIGQDLCLSALTVKSHLARISRKLGTGDRAQMVAIAFRCGLVH